MSYMKCYIIMFKDNKEFEILVLEIIAIHKQVNQQEIE